MSNVTKILKKIQGNFILLINGKILRESRKHILKVKAIPILLSIAGVIKIKLAYLMPFKLVDSKTLSPNEITRRQSKEGKKIVSRICQMNAKRRKM